jgi:hypothetical protein
MSAPCASAKPAASRLRRHNFPGANRASLREVGSHQLKHGNFACEGPWTLAE